MSTKARKDHHLGQTGITETSEGSAEKPATAGEEGSAEERFRLTQIRAYGLWEQAGRPGGDAAREQFWCDAKTEVEASQAAAE